MWCCSAPAGNQDRLKYVHQYLQVLSTSMCMLEIIRKYKRYNKQEILYSLNILVGKGNLYCFKCILTILLLLHNNKIFFLLISGK